MRPHPSIWRRRSQMGSLFAWRSPLLRKIPTSAPTDFRSLALNGKPKLGRMLQPEISSVTSWNPGFWRSTLIGRLVEGSRMPGRAAKRFFG